MGAAAVDKALFEELRQALAQASGRPAAEVPDPEVESCLAEILAGGAVPGVDEPATTLDRRIAERVDAAQDAIALVWGDRAYSRRGLWLRAGALAEALGRLELPAGAPVALDLAAPDELVIGLVGTLAAGAAALPLDPSCPVAWRARLAECAGVLAVVRAGSDGMAGPTLDTETGSGPRFPTEAPVVTLPLEAGREPVPAGVDPSSAALLVEAAGEPLVLEHRAVLGRLDRLGRIDPIDPIDPKGGPDRAVLHQGSFAGDGWVAGILRALVTGARLMVQSPGLPGRVAEAGAVEKGPDQNARLISGGPEAGGELLRGAPAAALEPLDGVALYVLDRRGQPLPVGVWGALHAAVPEGVRGLAGVAAATAERFRPDPFSERPGGRLTATGLVGRLRSGGYELRRGATGGRLLWHRGVRIDRRRIERELAGAGGASGCVVAPDGNGRLIAWVTVPAGTAWSPAALAAVERRAAERLAHWERPDVVAPCAALPAGDACVALEAAARRLPLAVAATFTARPLAEPLELWIETLGLSPEIHFAPYAQVIQELLRPDGTLATVRGGWSVLLVRLEDWTGPGGADAGADGDDRTGGYALARETVGDLLAALEQRERRDTDAAPTLLVICPPPAGLNQDRARARGEAAAAARREIVELLAARLASMPRVTLVDASALAEAYSVAEPDDPRADELGHIPYSGELFAALAAAIARALSAALVPGPAAVAVGALSPAAAASPALAELLAAQAERGRSVWLWPGLPEESPVAGAGQPAARRGDSATTLRHLAAETGIALERWAFLSTEAAEHEAVVAGCGEVLALRLPDEPLRFESYVRHLWPFDSPPPDRPAARRPVRVSVLTDDRAEA